MKKSVLLLIACLLLSMTACGGANNNVNSNNSEINSATNSEDNASLNTNESDSDEEFEEMKNVILDIYLDKIIIAEPDNNFTPSDLENYLREQNYSESNIEKAMDYGNDIYYISYYINKYVSDHTLDEIKSNLLDKNWVISNEIADHPFTSEEFEAGLLIYNHYKEVGVY